jgi:hypothetical protein
VPQCAGRWELADSTVRLTAPRHRVGSAARAAAAGRVISGCHPSEGTYKNRTHIPIIHRFYLFSALPAGVTIGYHPSGGSEAAHLGGAAAAEDGEEDPAGRAPPQAVLRGHAAAGLDRQGLCRGGGLALLPTGG